MCQNSLQQHAADEPLVFDIQRGSMVDGPGLRTTIFLKGCPLRCAWCHNPEAIRPQPETVTTERGERKQYGRRMSVDALIDIIRKDQPFYAQSGGGLTLSGGEPMRAFAHALEILRRAKGEGIHTCLDTTGFGTRAQWEQIVPLVDLFLLDYKLTDPEAHRQWTGISSKPLHANIRLLASWGARIRLRCPIIPGVNDHDAHFRGIVEMAAAIPELDGVDLMPYHATARYKYEQLGRSYPEGLREPTAADKSDWMRRMEALGCDPHRVRVAA